MRLPGSVGTRGFGGAIHRAVAIARRHGVTPRRMLQQVSDFTSTALAFGMRPTFPIVASRSVGAAPLARLQDAGAVFASHGLRHVDYTLLPKSHQADEIRTAVEALAGRGIKVTGFRAPYLRTNGNLREVVAEQGLAFDSSNGVLWPIAEEHARHPSAQAVLRFYGAPTVDGEPPLPTDGPVVRIPVSLPDDEMCFERLGMRGEAIAQQWRGNLATAFEQGAIYVLQLHPERYALLRDAAESLMDMARGLAPRLWLATLEEVAVWWRDRERAAIELEPDNGRWIARTASDLGACLELFPDGRPDTSGPEGRPHPGDELWLDEGARPAIGLSLRTTPEFERRLRTEGFHCERSARPDQWSCYLDLPPGRAAMSRADLLATIRQHASGPLVRLTRWPNGCQAAFCVTGDIDALCLSDFFSRLRG